MAADSAVSDLVLEASMQTKVMNPREKAIRDLFVTEYLQDYDAFAAALRCGFMRSFAEEYSVKFMDDAYVRQQIQAREQIQSEDDTNDDYNRQRVFTGLMKEAHYYGPGSSAAARVSALAKLAHILGMDTPKKPEDGKGKYRGGVMKVPDIADVTEWEEKAMPLQDKLVDEVRN